MYSLSVIEAESPRLRGCQGCFLMRPLFLACERLPSCCVFIGLFSVPCNSGVCLSSYKGHQAYCMRATLLLLRSHLTLMTLQRLYLQIRSHLHRFWGLGCGLTFCGATIQTTPTSQRNPHLSSHEYKPETFTIALDAVVGSQMPTTWTVHR